MKSIIIYLVILSMSGQIIFSAEDKKPPAPAAAKPAARDVFAKVKQGNRVTVILNNGNKFSGEVKVVRKDKIELDVTYDEPGLTGSIAFHKKDVREIKVRESLSPESKQEIKTQKTTEAKKYKSGLASSGTETGESAEKANETGEAKLITLLDKFPPGKVWNKERHDEIKGTAEYLQTDEEKEFLANYPAWLKAQELKLRTGRQELLAKFPPDQGWGDEKFKTLSTQFVRISISLTAEEDEFVRNYADWIKAKVEYEEEQKKKEEEGKTKPEESETPAIPSEK